MNEAWLYFYGKKLNMTREEIMECPWWFFQDLLACEAIYSGNAEPKKKQLTFEQAMRLR